MREINRTGVSSHLFSIILVVVVIVVVLLGAGFILKDKIFPFFDIPTNFTVVKFEGSEVIRYNIPEGNVQRFTGAEGLDIKGEVVFNGVRRVNGEDLTEDFESFYFDREFIEVEGLLASGFYEPSVGVYGLLKARVVDFVQEDKIIDLTIPGSVEDQFGKKNIFSVKRGSAVMDLVSANPDWPNQIGSENSPFAKISVSYGSEMDIASYHQSYGLKDDEKYYGSSSHQKIINEVVEWRDGVVENPMEIRYGLKQGDDWIEKTGVFNVELVDDFLVVDLKNEFRDGVE